jgi:hypothetical protein
MYEIRIEEYITEMSADVLMPFIPKVGELINCMLEHDNGSLDSNLYKVVFVLHNFSDDNIYAMTKVTVQKLQ